MAQGAQVIDHLIILMMENRSFDHYLGALSLEGRTDVEGLPAVPVPQPDLDGNPVLPFCLDGNALAGVNDPPHGWGPAHDAFNGGQNDGFVKAYQQFYRAKGIEVDPRIPLGYYTRKHLPAIYALADEFTVCDHWFGSVMSSTWPNRKYLHSGRRDHDNDTQTLPLPPGFRTTPIYEAIERATDPKNGRPLSWANYFCDLPFMAFWYRFALTHRHRFHHITQFLTDCHTDQLPTISVIDPPFSLADDHPPCDPLLGQKFIGLIVDALTHSPAWEKSALVLLYDENGGFADHVAPPTAPEPHSEDTPLGFRVPAVIVSPYAKKKYVSKVVYDHTAILKSIHTRWGVTFDERFGERWRFMPDIWSDAFDFEAPARPPATYTGEPLRDLHWASGIHARLNDPPGAFEALLERIFLLPELKALDRRHQIYDGLNELEQSVVAIKRMHDASSLV
ncbi:MAG TPA: alkaline phosphatase family protein [Limnochordia bacterium]|nr:alkaline phosphatase family protein [Limnochordia bacterium]